MDQAIARKGQGEILGERALEREGVTKVVDPRPATAHPAS